MVPSSRLRLTNRTETRANRLGFKKVPLTFLRERGLQLLNWSLIRSYAYYITAIVLEEKPAPSFGSDL